MLRTLKMALFSLDYSTNTTLSWSLISYKQLPVTNNYMRCSFISKKVATPIFTRELWS